MEFGEWDEEYELPARVRLPSEDASKGTNFIIENLLLS
jgi:hypothetical protein